MILDKAVQLAKKGPEQKVGFSMQIPVSLKEQFEEVCRNRGVTMTSLLLSFMQIAIEENRRKFSHLDLDELDKRIKNLKKYIKDLRTKRDKGETMVEVAIDIDEVGNPLMNYELIEEAIADAEYSLHLLMDEKKRREKQ